MNSLTQLDGLLSELTRIVVLEEQLTRILGFFQRDLKSLSCGIFFYDQGKYQLKIGRNISHTYTKNTIFDDENSFIRELKDNRHLSLVDSVTCRFEHKCRHILVHLLQVKKEVYGFIFADKDTDTFSEHEELVFKYISNMTALLIAVSKLSDSIAGKREFDDTAHVYRYKSFMEKGSYLFKLLQRSSINLSVAVLKMNKYVDLYKTHGRVYTESRIIELLTVIQEKVRPIDILGKVFDNTCGIIFPSLNAKQAKKIIIQINTVIQESDELSKLHISWGIAGMEKGITGFELLLSDAEEAAFDASRNDKNPVMIYEG